MLRRRALLKNAAGGALLPALLAACVSPTTGRRPAGSTPATAALPIDLRNITLPDGRIAEVGLGGDARGFALVAHHGTPADATTFADWHAACQALGLRLVCTSRPGYAGSTRKAGRTVAQAADDTAAVLDALGHGPFVTAGWSGGGPHALACAARLPGRCRAAATLAGVGPDGRADLDFLAGMGQENLDEFGAARKGEAVLRQWMRENGEDLRHVTGASLADAFGSLAPPVDRAVLNGGYADALAAVFRRSLAPGFDGWIDDDLAFTRDWGFDLRDIHAPVAVWQGELDKMVPFAHGGWLVAHVPGAQARLVPGHGHLSLVVRHRDEVLDELLAHVRR
jgi:pimeloyl-ACP methyl ester carboxylesterase